MDTASLATTTSTAKLVFKVRELDASGEPDEVAYDDDYELSDVEVTIADYVQPTPVRVFQQAWEAMGGAYEVRQQLSLTSLPSVDKAVAEIAGFLGMYGCDGTDRVPAGGRTTHSLMMSGTVLGGHRTLVSARFIFDRDHGVQMEMAVRSQNADVAQLISESVG